MRVDQAKNNAPVGAHSVQAALREDHARLERRFESIVAEASRGDREDLRRAWCDFERELSGHLDAEEAQLLGTFAKREPEEARAIAAEHAAIRAKLTEMGVDLDLHCLDAGRVRVFVDELRAHAAREDGRLYPWADEQLGPEARSKIRLDLGALRSKAEVRR